ncbi:hypothetical protein MUK42_19074 [Musa troglodytarum]|uniref:Fe2OG dioxygenase domain-containing protein n=1 Tax=Musa troglodytarum TaxID=320322 RepID=A0A9E7ET53_9LILI|nr:hypothetical protein MUK42_19074 [Musa troglodytarum]
MSGGNSSISRDQLAGNFNRLGVGNSPAWRGQQARREIRSVPEGGCGTADKSPGELGCEEEGRSSKQGATLPREQRESIRLSLVKRKKDFKYMEKVNGRRINVLEGLELHTAVFSAVEQRRIVDCIYDFLEKGRKGMLRERTYSEPRKWMRGKGRVTIQFGCCYNYAVDKHGNPPGIIRDEEVDPIPPLLKVMIKRMVAWHVLPPTCIPNSCIVNIYDKDDCIPPHIDHHDFVRPFCTVSFLSECRILFGTELKVLGPGEFSGSTAIPLPVGSVLILNGNAADVAKHCVPAVPSKRISITFRKMDDSKLPYQFSPEPDLQNLQPLRYPPKAVPVQQNQGQSSPIPAAHNLEIDKHQNNQNPDVHCDQSNPIKLTINSPVKIYQDDFPPLGSGSSAHPNRTTRSFRQ